MHPHKLQTELIFSFSCNCACVVKPLAGKTEQTWHSLACAVKTEGKTVRVWGWGPLDLRHSAIRVTPTVLHYIIPLHEKLPEIRMKKTTSLHQSQTVHVPGMSIIFNSTRRVAFRGIIPFQVASDFVLRVNNRTHTHKQTLLKLVSVEVFRFIATGLQN